MGTSLQDDARAHGSTTATMQQFAEKCECQETMHMGTPMYNSWHSRPCRGSYWLKWLKKSTNRQPFFNTTQKDPTTAFLCVFFQQG